MSKSVQSQAANETYDVGEDFNNVERILRMEPRVPIRQEREQLPNTDSYSEPLQEVEVIFQEGVDENMFSDNNEEGTDNLSNVVDGIVKDLGDVEVKRNDSYTEKTSNIVKEAFLREVGDYRSMEFGEDVVDEGQIIMCDSSEIGEERSINGAPMKVLSQNEIGRKLDNEALPDLHTVLEPENDNTESSNEVPVTHIIAQAVQHKIKHHPVECAREVVSEGINEMVEYNQQGEVSYNEEVAVIQTVSQTVTQRVQTNQVAVSENMVKDKDDKRESDAVEPLRERASEALKEDAVNEKTYSEKQTEKIVETVKIVNKADAHSIMEADVQETTAQAEKESQGEEQLSNSSENATQMKPSNDDPNYKSPVEEYLEEIDVETISDSEEQPIPSSQATPPSSPLPIKDTLKRENVNEREMLTWSQLPEKNQVIVEGVVNTVEVESALKQNDYTALRYSPRLDVIQEVDKESMTDIEEQHSTSPHSSPLPINNGEDTFNRAKGKEKRCVTWAELPEKHEVRVEAMVHNVADDTASVTDSDEEPIPCSQPSSSSCPWPIKSTLERAKIDDSIRRHLLRYEIRI